MVRNSSMLMVLEPSLSKKLIRAATCSGFRVTWKIWRPCSSSEASSCRFLFLSNRRNQWYRLRMHMLPRSANVFLIS